MKLKIEIEFVSNLSKRLLEKMQFIASAHQVAKNEMNNLDANIRNLGKFIRPAAKTTCRFH